MLGMHAQGRCKPGRRAQLQRKHFANRFGAREVLLTFGGGPVEAAAAAAAADMPSLVSIQTTAVSLFISFRHN